MELSIPRDRNGAFDPLLVPKQAEERLQVYQTIADCIEDWRDPDKTLHSLHQLVSQRVYQLVGGYEDANDSNQLRQVGMRQPMANNN